MSIKSVCRGGRESEESEAEEGRNTVEIEEPNEHKKTYEEKHTTHTKHTRSWIQTIVSGQISGCYKMQFYIEVNMDGMSDNVPVNVSIQRLTGPYTQTTLALKPLDSYLIMSVHPIRPVRVLRNG